MFHHTITTTKSMDEAQQMLEGLLKEEKFGVLWEFDVKDKLQEKGVDYNEPFRILEVCNPHEAKNVLTENKMVGYFLPCKIVIYEEAGKTKVGLPKPTAMMALLKDEKLLEIATEIETRLINVLNKIV